MWKAVHFPLLLLLQFIHQNTALNASWCAVRVPSPNGPLAIKQTSCVFINPPNSPPSVYFYGGLTKSGTISTELWIGNSTTSLAAAQCADLIAPPVQFFNISSFVWLSYQLRARVYSASVVVSYGSGSFLVVVGGAQLTANSSQPTPVSDIDALNLSKFIIVSILTLFFLVSQQHRWFGVRKAMEVLLHLPSTATPSPFHKIRPTFIFCLSLGVLMARGMFALIFMGCNCRAPSSSHPIRPLTYSPPPMATLSWLLEL